MRRRDKSLASAGNWTKIPRLPEPQPQVLIFTKLSWRSNTNQVQQLHISEEVDLHNVTHNSVYVIPHFFINVIVIDGLYIPAVVHISNGGVMRNDTATYNCQLQKINTTERISYGVSKNSKIYRKSLKNNPQNYLLIQLHLFKAGCKNSYLTESTFSSRLTDLWTWVR
jgi:hypothetical protein